MTRTLLMACSSLALVACGEPVEVGLPPPPREWLSCKEMPVAPVLEPLERITLPDGRVVYLAEKTNARDAEIARYIVDLRGAWFDCHNQIAKVRGYFEE